MGFPSFFPDVMNDCPAWQDFQIAFFRKRLFAVTDPSDPSKAEQLWMRYNQPSSLALEAVLLTFPEKAILKERLVRQLLCIEDTSEKCIALLSSLSSELFIGRILHDGFEKKTAFQKSTLKKVINEINKMIKSGEICSAYVHEILEGIDQPELTGALGKVIVGLADISSSDRGFVMVDNEDAYNDDMRLAFSPFYPI